MTFKEIGEVLEVSESRISQIHSKAFSLYILRKDISGYVEKYKKIKRLYAKPSTKDGLRILTKYGFEPLGGDTEAWVYNINR